MSSWPGLIVSVLIDGWRLTFTLRPCGQDVDGAVLVGREVDAVGRGRRAELVDLFLQRGDLLARLVERVDELLVLVEGLDELAVGLAQLVLEDHELLGRVLELLAEVDGLGLERADVGLEVLDLDLVLGQAAAVGGVGHRAGTWTGPSFLRRCSLVRVPFLLELLHVPRFLSAGLLLPIPRQNAQLRLGFSVPV